MTLLDLLFKAYKEYADHTFDCLAYDGFDVGYCSCGYEELAKRIEEARKMSLDAQSISHNGQSE